MKFPIDTDPSEYPKYAAKGFRIFRCAVCKLDVCKGDCEVVVEEFDPASEEFVFNLTSTNEELVIDTTALTDQRNAIMESNTSMEVFKYEDPKTVEDDFISHRRDDGFKFIAPPNVEEETVKVAVVFKDEVVAVTEAPKIVEDVKPDYSKMKMQELRTRFPFIKDTSKDGFLEQIAAYEKGE